MLSVLEQRASCEVVVHFVQIAKQRLDICHLDGVGDHSFVRCSRHQERVENSNVGLCLVIELDAAGASGGGTGCRNAGARAVVLATLVCCRLWSGRDADIVWLAVNNGGFGPCGSINC